MIPAARLQALPQYVYAVIGQRIQEMVASGKSVIRFDIGNPDTPPPQPVVDALCASANRPDRHGYAGYKGVPEFRQAVARYYQRRFGVTLDPDREILPLIGSKEGIVNLALAYLDPGDTVLVPDIAYPSYAIGASFTGADVSWIPLHPENGFRIDTSLIPPDVASRAKLLWVNYPNNPTGATIERSDYEQLVAFCSQYGIILASDNPYVDVTFDGYRAGSVLEVPDARAVSVEFVSFSKTYNMAGWRLGAAVGSASIIRSLLQVKSNMDSGHFHPIYDAGIVAVDTTTQEWTEARNALYARRRDKVLQVLPDLGLKAQVPKGALYIWAHVEDGDGTAYAREALEEALVSLGPGGAYGPGGQDYVRLSLTLPDTQIDEALHRLRVWHANR